MTEATASKPCDMPGCSSYAIGDGPWCPKHRAQSLIANEADWIKGSRAMKDQTASAETTGSWQVDAGFFRKTYPHKVSPECSCEIGSICQHHPCCYYGKTVPADVRSVLGCRN